MEQVIEIMVFGQLTDVVGTGLFSLPYVPDSDALLQRLYELHPLLKERKFVLSIDQRIVRANQTINSSSKIALLPPFSGG